VESNAADQTCKISIESGMLMMLEDSLKILVTVTNNDINYSKYLFISTTGRHVDSPGEVEQMKMTKNDVVKK